MRRERFKKGEERRVRELRRGRMRRERVKKGEDEERDS